MAVCVPPEELVGYGTLLQYYNTLSESWVTVAGTRDLATPTRSRPAIDTTDSQTGGFRTKIPNPLAEVQDVTYEMKFLASQWFVLEQMFNDGTFLEWRLVLMNERQWYISYCGFISEMGEDIPMEELVMSSITITPSGKPSSGYLN
jgi:predicted secreted protein